MTTFPDTAFDHLRSLRPAEMAAERDKLVAEAREILARSDDGALDADDSGRFERIEAEINWIQQAHEQRNRLLALATGSPGRIERGSDVGTETPSTVRRRSLGDQLSLTRNQSIAQWTRDRGLSRRDQDAEHASFDRYIRGIATGDWSGAALERSLSEGTNSAGGYLVPTPLAANVIDLARNQTRVFEAGAITVPLTARTLTMPRLTNESAPGWRNEGAALAANDLTFNTVTFTAQSLDRLIILSNELLQDSDPSVSDVIARSFAAQIAVALDFAALRGSGTAPTPRGVLNTAGITSTSHGANGTSPANFDWFIDAATAVRNNNFEPNAHIAAPRTGQSLAKLKLATTNAYMAPPTGMLPVLASNQVPVNLTVGTSNNCSEIYTGQWNQLAIGIRAGFSLRMLSERYADNGQTAFIANMRADVQVLQPAAFAVDLGILP